MLPNLPGGQSAKGLIFCLFWMLLLWTPLKAVAQVSPSIREEALRTLKQALTQGNPQDQLRAAEILLSLDYPLEATDYLLKIASSTNTVSRPILAAWSILAHYVPGDEKQQWSDKLWAAYESGDLEVKTMVLELLARQKIPLKGIQRESIEKVLGQGENLLNVNAAWLLALADISFETRLLEFVRSTNAIVRQQAIQALGELPSISNSSRDFLITSALDSNNSSAGILLLHAAFKHASARDKERLAAEIKRVAQDASALDRRQLFSSLAHAGTDEDIKILATQLGNSSSAPEIQIEAAHAILRIDRRKSHSLGWIDWSVILLYFLLMIAVGWYYSYRSKTADDFLLGGRNMRPSAVGLSLFATLLSTISYLSFPGEMIRHGPMLLCQVAAYPLICWIVGWFMIPYIMRLRVTSAYELLERRFGLSVRMVGSIFFLSLRLLWMAVIIYATTKAMIPIFGLPQSAAPWMCLILGIVTLLYTSMGGLKAVIVTDVIQTFILLFGAIFTLIIITYRLGGLGAWWPKEWDPNWDPPHFWFDAGSRTMIGAVISSVVWYICTTGSDQMAIQRYLSTRDAKSARRAFNISMLTDGSVMAFMMLLGLALLAYFRSHPDLMPDGYTIRENADQLFPQFIVYGLPVGITGFVMAGLLAAAMSSLSSGMNSSSSVIAVDFIERFSRQPTKNQVRLARIISAFVGAIVVALSLYVSIVPGNLLDICYKVVNLLVAPMFILFCMAMFVPWATSFGTLVGSFSSLATAIAIAYFNFLNLGILWILPASLVVGVIAGMVSSLVPIGTKPRVLLAEVYQQKV